MIDFACKKFDLDEVIRCGLSLSKAEYSLFRYLVKKNDWLTTHELASITKSNITTVQRNIKSLFEKNIIDRRQQNLNKGGYIFLYKSKEKEKLKEMLINILTNWSKSAISEIKSW